MTDKAMSRRRSALRSSPAQRRDDGAEREQHLGHSHGVAMSAAPYEVFALLCRTAQMVAI
jgi:hypothetical protein